MRVSIIVSVLLLMFTICIAGCSTTPYPYDLIARQTREITELRAKLAQQHDEFKSVQAKLQEKLKQQIDAGQIKIEKLKRGLVLTVLEDVLFDSGKAVIKPQAEETLKTMVGVLKEECPHKDIAIEGHTDNFPIEVSGWKSNWELSTARAQSVLHFFVENGIYADRLRVVGFGEYRPVASNETEEGRKQNRRVEIVILPENIRRIETE